MGKRVGFVRSGIMDGIFEGDGGVCLFGWEV